MPRARSARTPSPTSFSRSRSPPCSGRFPGWFLAINLESVSQESFEPLYTFLGFAALVLGGLASFWGSWLGSIILWVVLEGMRFADLPFSDDKDAALRFVLVGLVLILLMAFRPQGSVREEGGDGAR